MSVHRTSAEAALHWAALAAERTKSGGATVTRAHDTARRIAATVDSPACADIPVHTLLVGALLSWLDEETEHIAKAEALARDYADRTTRERVASALDKLARSVREGLAPGSQDTTGIPSLRARLATTPAERDDTKEG